VIARQRWSLLAIMTCLVLAMVAMNAVWGTPSTGRAQAGPPSIIPSPDISDWVPRIAIAYDQGGRRESFNELAREGAQPVVDAFDADLIEITAEPEDTDADLEERLRLLAETRAGIVIVIGSAYAGTLAEVAPTYATTGRPSLPLTRNRDRMLPLATIRC
jgi:basic membrane lipoprotein Med (substrate-binding protein (PBP1-ABC) superfamily)